MAACTLPRYVRSESMFSTTKPERCSSGSTTNFRCCRSSFYGPDTAPESSAFSSFAQCKEKMTFLRSANMKNGKAKQLQPIFIVTTCEPYAFRRPKTECPEPYRFFGAPD